MDTLESTRNLDLFCFLYLGTSSFFVFILLLYVAKKAGRIIIKSICLIYYIYSLFNIQYDTTRIMNLI